MLCVPTSMWSSRRAVASGMWNISSKSEPTRRLCAVAARNTQAMSHRLCCGTISAGVCWGCTDDVYAAVRAQAPVTNLIVMHAGCDGITMCVHRACWGTMDIHQWRRWGTWNINTKCELKGPYTHRDPTLPKVTPHDLRPSGPL